MLVRGRTKEPVCVSSRIKCRNTPNSALVNSNTGDSPYPFSGGGLRAYSILHPPRAPLEQEYIQPFHLAERGFYLSRPCFWVTTGSSSQGYNLLCVSLVALQLADIKISSLNSQASRESSKIFCSPFLACHRTETLEKDQICISHVVLGTSKESFQQSVSFRGSRKCTGSSKSWGEGLHPSRDATWLSGGICHRQQPWTHSFHADSLTRWARRSSLSLGLPCRLASRHNALGLLLLQDKADQMRMLPVCVQCLRTCPHRREAAFSSEKSRFICWPSECH